MFTKENQFIIFPNEGIQVPLKHSNTERMNFAKVIGINEDLQMVGAVIF